MLHIYAGSEMVSLMSIWLIGSMSGLTSAQTQEMEGELLHALTAVSAQHPRTRWELQSLPSSEWVACSLQLTSAANPPHIRFDLSMAALNVHVGL